MLSAGGPQVHLDPTRVAKMLGFHHKPPPWRSRACFSPHGNVGESLAMDSRVGSGEKGLQHLLGLCFPHSFPATEPLFSFILLSSCLCCSPPDMPGAAAAKGKERGGRDPARVPAAAPCPARALAGGQDHRVSPHPCPAVGWPTCFGGGYLGCLIPLFLSLLQDPLCGCTECTRPGAGRGQGL